VGADGLRIYQFPGPNTPFSPPTFLPLPSSQTFLDAVDTADLDGDGRRDIVVTTGYGAALWRIRSLGAGTFDSHSYVPLPANVAGSTSLGNSPAITPVDADNDGFADLLMVHKGGGVDLWRNPGFGPLPAATTLPTGGAVQAFTVRAGTTTGLTVFSQFNAGR